MRLQYPKWLKDLLLPFENPDHPLYADPAVMQQREAEQQRFHNPSNDELYDDLDVFEEEYRAIMEGK